LQLANSTVFTSISCFFDIRASQIACMTDDSTEIGRWANENLRTLSVSQEEQISLHYVNFN